MRRCLVVAHQTLLSNELLAAMRSAEATAFYVVVPMRHPAGAWSEGSIRVVAQERLREALERFRSHGLDVDGCVGDARPAAAVGDALRRDPAFDEIIVSTLPSAVSVWIGQDIPHRIAREHPGITVTHVVSELVPA